MEWQELTATAGLLVGFGFLIKYLTTDLTNTLNELKEINVKLIDKINNLVDVVASKWKE